MFWLNAAILMSVSVQKLLAPVLVALVFAVFTWDYMRSVSTFNHSVVHFTPQSIDFTIMCFVQNDHSHL